MVIPTVSGRCIFVLPDDIPEWGGFDQYLLDVDAGVWHIHGDVVEGTATDTADRAVCGALFDHRLGNWADGPSSIGVVLREVDGTADADDLTLCADCLLGDSHAAN